MYVLRLLNILVRAMAYKKVVNGLVLYISESQPTIAQANHINRILKVKLLSLPF